eukprot:Sspe_Gene.88451::Locus_60475_Transcript_1_1_Confidence_1.000_Length_850::g.88451::m.88451/K20367/ERGIC3, ERV46; endoplasmic reticulum-Golgi intermediate compartment protein 3
MKSLRRFDAFRTVPTDLAEATTTGAILTVVAGVLCLSLFICELWAFLTITTRTRIVMDTNQDQLLRINFDITMFDLACDYVSVGVWDSFGSDRLNITKNIMKQKLDHMGNDKGHPYSDEELVELDDIQGELSEEERAEYDADWATSSDSFKHDDFDMVVDSHDFTVLLFYADWCPPCRAFKPTWNQFEDKVNQGQVK